MSASERGAGRAGERRAHGRRSSPDPAQGQGQGHGQGHGQGSDLRESILAATARLLEQQRFDDLSVARVLEAAGVSRGSFYFYFDSKHDVLAELVRRATAQGMEAAEPWLARPADKIAALRAGTTSGARRWRENAPILRAIVENWQSDPRLGDLWLTQMQSFTSATVTQISADPEAMAYLAGQDLEAVASGLTWLSERLYYLAACEIPPFGEEDALIGTLVHIWASALYGKTATQE